ncbi:MAG: 5'-nucleotidase C-terminal domain-containing protein [Pseudodonghicola sp.]
MPGAELRLRILATSDLHMHLTGYDYCTGRSDPGVGLARLAGLIAEARAEAARDRRLVLLFDNGDAIQGTPLGDLAATAPGSHPLMRAFGHLGYDAAGLGNHDFDFGLEALARALAAAPCPMLCANLRALDAGPALPGALPHAVLERQAPDGTALRIGVFSVLPPQTAQWNRHLLAGRLGFGDMTKTAAREIAALRRAGCDLVIALAHTGPGAETAQPGMEDALLPIAALPGLDAVIGGHTHELRSWDGDDRAPVVMPGYAGSHLGVIDLELTRTATGWQAATARAGLRPVARRGADGQLQPLVAEDAGLLQLLSPDHAAARAAMRAPAGHSPQPLHSYFSFFAPDRGLATLAAAQAAALRPLLAGTEAAALPLLSATAPAKYGARAGPLHYTDVPAGQLQRRHLADLCPFPNALSAVEVSGAQLLDWLERTASLFHRIAPGSRDGLLVDPRMPGHGFDVLHGLDYRIDLSQPARFGPDGGLRDAAARRIRDARWNGALLRPEARFVVALSSYRAAGGGQVAALAGARQLTLRPLSLSELLRRYLSEELPRDPLEQAPPPWSFVPLVAGTAAIARTGPGARPHLAELAGRGIADEGLDAEGFLRLRVPLDRN